MANPSDSLFLLNSRFYLLYFYLLTINAQLETSSISNSVLSTLVLSYAKRFTSSLHNHRKITNPTFFEDGSGDKYIENYSGPNFRYAKKTYCRPTPQHNTTSKQDDIVLNLIC
ncbi:hypothetical protein Bca101_075325 [Brassica carinata]